MKKVSLLNRASQKPANGLMDSVGSLVVPTVFFPAPPFCRRHTFFERCSVGVSIVFCVFVLRF